MLITVEPEEALYGNELGSQEDVDEKQKVANKADDDLKKAKQAVSDLEDKNKKLDQFDKNEITKESNLKQDTLDDFIVANIKYLKSRVRNDMTTTTINGFPTSLERVISGISSNFRISQFAVEDALITFGLDKLYYQEISSFGLIKKTEILNKLNKYIEIPISKTNKLEIIGEKCITCKRNMCLSSTTSQFFMHVKVLLDIGSSDLALMCLLLSFETSKFVSKEFRWVNKDYKLRREKKGLKIIKTKNLYLRERLRFYAHEISKLLRDQQFDEFRDSTMTKEDEADLREIRDIIHQMRLKRDII